MGNCTSTCVGVIVVMDSRDVKLMVENEDERGWKNGQSYMVWWFTRNFKGPGNVHKMGQKITRMSWMHT